MNVLDAARIRHIAVLRAIAEGVCTVPDMRTRLPQYGDEALRISFGVLRKLGIARSVVKANNWRPARYALLMSLDEALTILTPPVAKTWDADALTQAWLPVRLPQGEARIVVRG